MKSIVRTMFVAAAVAMAAAAASPRAGAQRAKDAAPAPDSQRSEVTGILVDIVVRTASGDPVTDLKPEEFELYEDGVRQEIGSMTPVFRDRQGLPMPSAPVDVPAGTAAARAPRPAPPSSPAAAGGTPPEV